MSCNLEIMQRSRRSHQIVPEARVSNSDQCTCTLRHCPTVELRHPVLRGHEVDVVAARHDTGTQIERRHDA